MRIITTGMRFHALLSTFKRKTGCPVLINTSFNVRGEPIVRTSVSTSVGPTPPGERGDRPFVIYC